MSIFGSILLPHVPSYLYIGGRLLLGDSDGEGDDSGADDKDKD